MPTHAAYDPAYGMCIWTGAEDSASSTGALRRPLTNIPRIKWSSALDNIGYFNTKYSGTITQTIEKRHPTYILVGEDVVVLTHNLGYAPHIAGWVTEGGIKRPIIGSIIVERGWHYWAVSFVSTDTQIIMTCNMLGYRPASSIPAGTKEYPAWNIAYEMYLSNYGMKVDGTLQRPAAVADFECDSSLTKPFMRVGRFDTKYLYPYVSATGRWFVPSGRTIDFAVGWKFESWGGISGNVIGVGFRYSVNSGVTQSLSTITAQAAFPGNNASFTATGQKVDL